MKTQAKFEVVKVSELAYGGKRSEIQRIAQRAHVPDEQTGVTLSYDNYVSTGIPVREITLSAVYGGSEENESFATSTPTGTITFLLNNPSLAEEFKPGQFYYVDFTPAGQ